MTPGNSFTRSYLTLQPAVALPADRQSQIGDGIYIPCEPGPGLLYVEPTFPLSALQEFGPLRTIVIPDYVFWNLIERSADLELEILDVDFVPDPLPESVYKPTVRRFIESGRDAGNKYHDLIHFLDEARLPITAIAVRDRELADNQHSIKIHGSGLIIIQGDPKTFEGAKRFLERLTHFLVDVYLKPIQSESVAQLQYS
jgi:hypothetical protein